MREDTRNSTDRVAAVIMELRSARMARGYTWRAMATMIESDYAYRITEDQYRAVEQGITKRVPLDLVIIAMKILDLDPADVFREAMIMEGAS